MLRLASDADFNGKILRGLFLRQPDLDLVRVQDAGLRMADDPTILAWAAHENRILLTNDRETMIEYAAARIKAGLPMSGAFVIRRRVSYRRIIEEIRMIALCSTEDEWKDRIEFIPL